MPVDDAGGIELRIIVDHSVLEIFANGVPLSARLHVEGKRPAPRRPGDRATVDDQAACLADGGRLAVRSTLTRSVVTPNGDDNFPD